jgi:hypothetical protein
VLRFSRIRVDVVGHPLLPVRQDLDPVRLVFRSVAGKPELAARDLGERDVPNRAPASSGYS